MFCDQANHKHFDTLLERNLDSGVQRDLLVVNVEQVCIGLGAEVIVEIAGA